MFIVENQKLIMQSVSDIWIPIIIPFLILMVVFIVIACFRKEKNKNEKERKKK